MREPFTTLTTTVVAIEMENIDTDRVIPARFLKTTASEGFGDKLFHDLPRDINPLAGADPSTRGRVLAAGNNFGCGSSREHAAWAIRDAGFRAIISSGFADIFRQNALNNGILPARVPADCLARLFALVRERPSATVTINLERQTIRFAGEEARFDIPPREKTKLLSGLDDIDYLLASLEKIARHEKTRQPWN
jgi:3-isopropylmalate/(R)-2-methylmalate dehydratase small subunit